MKDKQGLIIGHEPVGAIEELGPGVTRYAIGGTVLVGAITPCGQCRGCLSGHQAQCGHGDGYEALGGWRFGNTIKIAIRPKPEPIRTSGTIGLRPHQ